MKRLFTQFSFPGGIPSHVAPGNARLDPRRRRTGLFPGPRLRGGLRQSRPARLPASSATARRRPGRWPPAGTPTNSSIPPATARSCPSCTSTATRSPTRPCWPASATRSWKSFFGATATSPILSKATIPTTMHQHHGRDARHDCRRDQANPERGADATALPSVLAGR